MTIPRVLAPHLNPTGLIGSLSALWALGDGIWNVVHHHGAISPQVIVAAINAAGWLYAHQIVTPVADPRDGNGVSLKPPPPPPLSAE